VMTSTRNGGEKNATVFARFWVEALRDPSADVDKNEVISALEAFTYATAKTKQFYETQKRLATEHPAIDGGDKQGPLMAGRFPLMRIGAIRNAANDPVKQPLLAKREQIEQQIDNLKLQKAAMPIETRIRTMTKPRRIFIGVFDFLGGLGIFQLPQKVSHRLDWTGSWT